jgi:hypothetical protein
MNYKTILRKGSFIVAASLLTLGACKRSDNSSTTSTSAPANADDNGGYASDAAKLETNNNDVISIADAAGNTGSADLRTTATTSTTISTCATITNDTSVTPHVLTINFGPTDCTCIDGKNRKGEIIVSYTGAYKDSGTVRTITYNNYYVNDNQIKGTKVVTNMGTNSSGQVYYDVTVNDTMVIASDSIITWTGTRTRTWDAGYSTPTRSDDVYLIGGTTTLTRATGHMFTFDITTPLQIANSCPYIEAGIADITSSTFTGGTRILNYGTGNCDDEADLTIGSVTYHITLR